MSEDLINSEYMQQFKGSFTSALRWPQLDTLWQTLLEQPQGWYVYAIGEAPPTQTADEHTFGIFIKEIDELLRREHDEDYCGIVYSDEPSAPTMVKIYDPNNLGVSCGYSDNPPLPGWVLSRIAPIDLQSDQLVPKSRKRWWQKIFK